MKKAGVEPSNILAFPGFNMSMVCIDVLHSMDLGATQDAIGNLLWEAIPFLCKGNNFKDRVADCFLQIKKYYKDFNCEKKSRLQGLTPEIVKIDKKTLKINTK